MSSRKAKPLPPGFRNNARNLSAPQNGNAYILITDLLLVEHRSPQCFLYIKSLSSTWLRTVHNFPTQFVLHYNLP